MCVCVCVCVCVDVKQAQRRRASLAPNADFYGYLRNEVAARLVDRLADINKSFPVAAEIGCGNGAHVSKLLHTITTPQSHAASDVLADAAAAANPAAANAVTAAAAASAASSGSYSSPPIAPPTISVPGRGSIRTLHLCDSCPASLARTQAYWVAHSGEVPVGREQLYHVVDEEGSLPFAPASLDLIVSNLDMHWVNDLPAFMKRCRIALKPDGVFLASMMGGATLQEMRSATTNDGAGRQRQQSAARAREKQEEMRLVADSNALCGAILSSSSPLSPRLSSPLVMQIVVHRCRHGASGRCECARVAFRVRSRLR